MKIEDKIFDRNVLLSKYFKKIELCTVSDFLSLNHIFERLDKILEDKYIISYRDKLILKEEFLSFNQRELEFLENYLYSFLMKIQPTFPYESIDTLDVDEIIKNIRNYKYEVKNNCFHNNISSIGTLYLKHHFTNFYDCFNKNNTSPVESWRNKKQMRAVIRYRIGLNYTRETFDFSLHQMVRGLSAYRKMVSFFKPVVAAQIYKYFLKDIKNPIVIDPCAGFGGRLLGFKSIYPEGKYIGIEPNKETYKNLVELSKNFTNIELHNCKLEDYKGSKDCDISFTSIPYFDWENYNNDFFYKDLDEWNNTFIESLLTFKNLIVNLPIELQEKINIKHTELYYLLNNTSHFNKNKVDLKGEYILKCF